MNNLTQLISGLLLAFILLSSAHAGSVDISVDPFSMYQSDMQLTEEGDGSEKNTTAGEEEEPDC